MKSQTLIMIIIRMAAVLLTAALPARAAPPVTAGLVLCLDACAITGLNDGDKVSQWNDLSGYDRHASQANDVMRPMYQTNVINGKPVVRFKGHSLTTPGITIDCAALSVFAVCKGNHAIVFEDDFETWEGWHAYDSGSVCNSSSQARTGTYSLLKDGNGDPHGGYKDLGATIGNEYVFEGWIYRPDPWSGGAADRLAISDDNANGYGFYWNDSTLAIERRSAGSAATLSSKTSASRPENEWYRFRFEAFGDGTFRIEMFDAGDTLIDSLEHATPDAAYAAFTRIYVHGGYEFYLDDISITCGNFGTVLSQKQFEDNFETWEGWHAYDSGSVYNSSSQARTGIYSLLKDGNSDPHGGYKDLGLTIGNEYVFEGWIYRPDPWSGGAADRLAISDDNANGYGFYWSQSSLQIERRSAGSAATLSTKTSASRPENEWYRFRFEAFGDGTFRIEMFDAGNTLLDSLAHATPDTAYAAFTRIYVHGGYEFYLDDVSIGVNWLYRYNENNIEALVNVNGVLESVSGAAEAHKLIDFVSDDNASNLYIDGVPVDTTNYAAAPSSSAAPIDIGGLSLNGDIAEILIYNRALPDDEREAVDQYLGQKWMGWPAPPRSGAFITELF